MKKRQSERESRASSATLASLDSNFSPTLPDISPSKLVPLKTIGRGCFGKVILAKHEKELVAVKVAGKHQIVTAADFSKAITELKIMRNVAPRSPFLCNSRGGFQTDDAYILVMNFSAGGDLFFHLQFAGPMPEWRARLMMMQAILGLQHLHLRGIVHRDLKPENILITSEGRAQITDFGLSKYLPRAQTKEESEGRTSFSSFSSEFRNESGLASSGCFPWIFSRRTDGRAEATWGMTRTRCGTPTYRTPDAVAGREYGLEADYWSLGCILYECLTGMPAFSGKTLKELNQVILSKNPSYRNLRRQLSPKARGLIQELLIKDRTKRLGYGPRGAKDVKKHPFFDVDERTCGFTWDQVANLEAPPIVFLSESGIVQEPENAIFFAEDFTSMDIVETLPPSPAKNLDGYQQIANEVLLNKFITPSIPLQAPLNPESNLGSHKTFKQ